MLKNQQIDHIINEATILSNMKHPFIVTLIFNNWFILIRFRWKAIAKMIHTFT